MSRRMWFGFVTAVAMLGAGLAAHAEDQTKAPDTDVQESPAPATDQSKAPDMTGQWKLDLEHSDMPQRGGGRGGERGGRGGWGGHHGGRGGMGGGGMMGGGMGGGMMGGEGHMGGGMHRNRGEEAGSEGMHTRPVRLPDLMHVTETPNIVSIEDSTGAVLEEIATVSAEADTFAQAPGAQHVRGQWKKDQLVIERPGFRGGTMTETLALKDKGNTLEISTKMQPGGDMPAREFKRVYRRVAPTG